MFANILLVFVFIPFKVHRGSVVRVYLARQACFYRKPFNA
jgi:hypothetical protein